MLVIDDNNLKLLKMKEKLLEIATNDKIGNTLDDYKRLAREIDAIVYDSIVTKIKETDYHNQSLEEQLIFLGEIEEEYVELDELQCRFKNVYEKYSDDELELSTIENIKIDVIRNRISNINGYLINIQNIENSKKELVFLSDKLIEEEQKKDTVGFKLLELDNVLRENAKKVEGRIFTSIADIEYTSVVKEYTDIGLNLEELFNDSKLLDEKLQEFKLKRQEKEELLNVAEICYNNMPDTNNKMVYENIERDAIKARYELTLLKIANLLYKSTDEYDDAKNKREKLIDLIKYRSACLNNLGVKISIDPFARMRINEQLEVVKSLGDNTKEIMSIRRKIGELNTSIESSIKKNNIFLEEINKNIDLFEDNLSLANIDISSVDDIEKTSEEKSIQENQVVGMSVLPINFMLDRVLEKTDGVIKRVNEMVNHKEKKINVSFNVEPELVIQRKDLEEKEFVSEQKTFYDEVLDNNLFEDMPSLGDEVVSFDNNDKEEKIDNDFVHFDDDVIEKSMFPSISEVIHEDKNESVKESDEISVNSNLDLFQEIVPFEETILFNDKYEDSEVNEAINFKDNLTHEELIHLNDSEPETEFVYDSLKESLTEENNDDVIEDISIEESMPDAFWVTQEDENVEEDKVLSFDEQIDYLMNNDNTDSKVRRKVA